VFENGNNLIWKIYLKPKQRIYFWVLLLSGLFMKVNDYKKNESKVIIIQCYKGLMFD